MAIESDKSSGDQKVTKAISQQWFGTAMKQISGYDYKLARQKSDYKGEQFSKPRMHFANRTQNLGVYFDKHGTELMSWFIVQKATGI